MDSNNAQYQAPSYKPNLKTMPVSHWFLAAQATTPEMLNTIICAAYKAGRLEYFLHIRTALSESALMLAARRGHIETVKALLTAYDLCNTPKTNVQVALNQVDRYGNTVLIWVAQFGHIETLNMLIARLNPEQLHFALSVKNKSGYNALTIAQKRKHEKTVVFLIGCLEYLNQPIPDMTIPEPVIAPTALVPITPVVFSIGEKNTKRSKTATELLPKSVTETKRKTATEKAPIPKAKSVEPKRKKRA